MVDLKLFSEQFLLLFILTQMVYLASATTTIVPKACSTQDTATNIRVTRGWPALVSCKSLDFEYLYDYYDGEESHLDYSCSISDEHSILHAYNGTYNIYDDQHSDEGIHYYIDKVNTNMTLFIHTHMSGWSDSGCVIISVVEPSYESRDGCNDVVDHVFANQHQISIGFPCDNNYLHLECKESRSDIFGSDPVFTFVPSDGYQVTWYRGCDVIDDIDYVTHYSGNENSATFSVINIPKEKVSSGNYSCQVSYNNHSKFIRHFDVKVKLDGGSGRGLSYSFKSASSNVEGKIGSKVDLNCHGISSNNLLLFYWTFNDKKISENDRSAAGGIYTIQQNIIEMYTAEDQAKCLTLTKNFTTSLTISNFQPSNKGVYACFIKTTKDERSQNITVTISEETETKVHFLHILILVFGAILFGAFLCVLLFWCFQLDLLLLWKNYFASYDEADRDYDVFLSYYFTNETNCEVRNLLTSLMNWFKKNNYSTFDLQLSPAGELYYNQVCETVPKCHRMVIIITRAYLGNENSDFDTLTGILSSIKGDTKLIFVLTPEIKQYLKEQAQQNNHRLGSLLVTMKQKQNSVILWNGVHRRKRFFKTLDVAMPKLPMHQTKIEKFSKDEEAHFGDEVSSKMLLNTVTSLVVEQTTPESPRDMMNRLAENCNKEVEI